MGLSGSKSASSLFDLDLFLSACENGETVIVGEQLAQGINVDIQNEESVCGLFKAAKHGHDDVIQILLKHKANVNKRNGDEGKSALMAASNNGYNKTVKILIEYEADINMQDIEGWSALLMASYSGYIEVVKCLLEHKACVNIQAKNGWSALMFAVLNNNSDITKLLLEYGAHVDMQNNVGATSLMIATKNGYEELTNLLVEYKADVNIQMKDGWSALMFAGESGQTKIARLLLEYKADINMQMSEGLTPLIIASEKGHMKLIELLLEYKADTNKTTNIGLSALMVACQIENVQIIKLLLEYHANVNAQMKENGLSPLMIATHTGNVKTIKLLVEHYANLDVQMIESSLSALMIACQQGHTEIMKILLEYGAHVNLLTGNRLSALMLSCLIGNKEATAILLEYQADVNLQMNDGLSALMIGSQNGNIENVRLLLEHRADVDMSDIDGWSALMYSSQNGYTDIVELLLEYCANVNKQDCNGWSALMVASQNGHVETADSLLECGADENLQTIDKLSALMIASMSGHTDNVQLLLQHGADMNMCNADSWTALMFASQYGYTKIVELLLEYHASINKQNNNGWSALMIASQFGQYDTANTLLKHGANKNLQANDKSSALMIASQFGHIRNIQLLLKQSADVNMQDKDGSSALIIASQKENSNIVQLLVECGSEVDVNQADNNGWTALMYASKLGCRESVMALLEAGANVNLKAGNGWTALMIANLNGQDDIAKLLRESKLEGGSQRSYGTGGIIRSSGRKVNMQNIWSSGQSNYSPLTGGFNRTAMPYCSTRGLKFTLGISSSGYGTGSGSEQLHSTSELSSGSPSINEASQLLRPLSMKSIQKLAAWKCAEKTVLVINSEEDHYFSWAEFGLNLHIPSRSLPPGFHSCTVHIIATIVGDYQFPPNSHLVSGVYWLRCIPACKFSKPVTLEIQHCGRQNNLSKFYFVKANLAQQLIQEQYVFHKAEGCSNTNHGVFPAKSSYGFIQLESFSGYGVIQDDSEERNYCANLYYLGQDESKCQIHFTISWNTDVHRSALNDYYISKGSESAADQEIEFESDRISLDIPVTGVVTQNRGWKIIPLINPVIMKKEVDSFSVGKRIPACQLQATANVSTILTDLYHLINLIGAKEPFNIFTIYRHCDSYGGSSKVRFKWSEPILSPSFSEQIGPKPSESSTATLKTKVKRYSGGLLRKFKRQKRKWNRKRTQQLFSSGAASLIDPSLGTQMEIGLPLSLNTVATQETADFHDLSCIQEVTVTESESTSAPLKPPPFVILLREISDEVSPRWEDIGLQLQLSPNILEIIKKDNPGDCRACLREMLKEWMKQLEPPPSWRAIVTAIEFCSYHHLARKLKREYLSPLTREKLV